MNKRAVNSADMWAALTRRMNSKLRPKKWWKTTERLPQSEGAYYTTFKEFKGERCITYYGKTSKGMKWSSMYEPTSWSEAVEQ